MSLPDLYKEGMPLGLNFRIRERRMLRLLLGTLNYKEMPCRRRVKT